MQENANFLCEIGTEEIPAGYIPFIIKNIENIFGQKLSENRISFKKIEAYATPRRLAVIISEMAESQTEDEIEVKGPSLKAAYAENGEPTKALSGFMNGNKIAKDDIFTKKTDKGEYVYARKKMEAKKTEEIIPVIVEYAVKNIGTPKKMRWSNKDISFPRPVSYFLILLNDKVVPFQISGINSSNQTRGHYVQNNKMIEIKSIPEYETALINNSVILDHSKRKEYIRKELIKAAENINGKLVEDPDLLDTVTFLTENPNVVVCQFSEDFLNIPDIVLITEMKEHQKYFAVTDKNGKLTRNFLVVSNNPAIPFIKKGNERVISARFNDAAFFFKEDRETKLIDKVESLKSVLFHRELGTIYDKVSRMSSIADHIGRILNIETGTKEKIKRAVLLSKADLNTHMVFEFSSLQGKIGRIYALLDGEDREIADAINDHYKPRFAGEDLPDSLISIIVSMAEKFDNIVGAFSVGNIPKGSEDPYALRRQANAIVDMLIKNRINIGIDDILKNISSLYKNGEQHIDKILDFISARAKTIFQEKGYKYDEIDACLSIGFYDYFELYKRAESIHEFRKQSNFSEMLLSFKRMNNILTIFLEKNPAYKPGFEPKNLEEAAEKDLYNFFNSKRKEINNYIESNNYTALFNLLTEGKATIDIFFDKVMVMSENAVLRDNRLALLNDILSPFKKLLDFSKIAE